MSIDLTPIFQALITLIAALITYKLLPWIKARTSAEQQDLLLITTRTLVYAAEQLYGPMKGAEKLAYVKDKLAEKGFAVDIDAIEAMVKELDLSTVEIPHIEVLPLDVHPPEQN